MPLRVVFRQVSDEDVAARTVSGTCALRCLDISSVALSSTHPDLMTLDLSLNNLESLSGLRPRSLPNLHSLSARDNLLEDLGAVGTLTSLRSLFLSNNMLTSLPEEPQWHNLVTLDISLNSVTSLDGLAVSAPNLARLDARLNELVSVPLELAHMRFLRELILSGNRIESVGPLRRARALERLELAGNRLASLDAVVDVVRTMPRLTQLVLCENEIDREPRYWMTLLDVKGLERLDGVDISGRAVTEVVRATRQAGVEELIAKTRLGFHEALARAKADAEEARLALERKRAEVEEGLRAAQRRAEAEMLEALRFLEEARARGKVAPSDFEVLLRRAQEEGEGGQWKALLDIEKRLLRVDRLPLERLQHSPPSPGVPMAPDQDKRKGGRTPNQRLLPVPDLGTEPIRGWDLTPSGSERDPNSEPEEESDVEVDVVEEARRKLF